MSTAQTDPFALPLDALAAWMRAHVSGFGGTLSASKFKGGQSNPTYKLDAGGQSYVLRRKPPGVLLKSAHAVDREFRVLQALQGGPVPVARPLALCTDDRVLGSMFYIMAFVPGRIEWDPALPTLTPAQRGAHHRAIIDTLAALHTIDPAAVGLGDFGQPGNYFARQVKRWSGQYRDSVTTPDPRVDQLISWLEAHVPADDGQSVLVHGDWRIDNLMFDLDLDAPRILAIVDWELATLGHPLADLSYYCMSLRLPRNPVLSGLKGIDRAAAGIPDEASMVARYAELRGLAQVPHWPFTLAFNFFRLAAIAQGVARRAELGNASNERAAQVGAMVPLLAQMGLEAAHES